MVASGIRKYTRRRRRDKPFQRRTWKRANPGLDDLARPRSRYKRRGCRREAGWFSLAIIYVVTPESRGSRMWSSGCSSHLGYGLKLRLTSHANRTAGISSVSTSGRMPPCLPPQRTSPLGQLDAFACFPRVPSLQKRGLADGCGNAYLEMAKRNELLIAGERVSDIPEAVAGIAAAVG